VKLSGKGKLDLWVSTTYIGQLEIPLKEGAWTYDIPFCFVPLCYFGGQEETPACLTEAVDLPRVGWLGRAAGGQR